jgi:hypothetical protein
MQRRTVLLGSVSSVLAGAVLLSGCNLNNVLVQVANYADEFTAAANTILTDIQPYVSTATYTQMQGYYTELQAADKDIDTLAANTSSGSATGVVSSFVGILNSFVSLAAGLPGLPVAIATGLEALSIGLSVIESLVGLVASKKVKLANINLTQAQALTIIRGLAARSNAKFATSY